MGVRRGKRCGREHIAKQGEKDDRQGKTWADVGCRVLYCILRSRMRERHRWASALNATGSGLPESQKNNASIYSVRKYETANSTV